MKVTRETLQKIAHLARLEVKPENEQQLLQDLSEILTWVEQLNEVDTDGVEPLTHMASEVNQLREDSPSNRLNKEQAFKVAPDHDGQFFKVPRVVKNKGK